MKTTILLTLLVLSFFNCFSQGSFDKSINNVSNDLAEKLILKNKKKIAVLFVKENSKLEVNKADANKSNTVAGKYIADMVSVNLINNPQDFQVFDRDNLSGIVEAKKLIDEGYIDAENTKKLGIILAVEVLIIGNYTVLNDSIKLTLKALDVNTGSALAANMRNLPIDADAASLLGIRLPNNSSFGNKGFNNSLKSNEDYNNPNSVATECETKNTGDYCFTNQKNFVIKLDYSKVDGGVPLGYNVNPHLTLEPGQTGCVYELTCGAYKYSYEDPTKRVHTGYSSSYGGDDTKPQRISGQFKVEKCASKTLIIK